MASTRSYGVDVSDPVTAEQWTCLAGRGCKFAAARCYRDANDGEPDVTCPDTVAGAWAAGLHFVDVYHFPAGLAKPAAAQAAASLAFLSAHAVRYRRLWLDVEGSLAAGRWSTDLATNVAFIGDFLAALSAAGVTGGIYCSTAGWSTLTGDTTAFAAVPLWWSSHGRPYAPFGGWAAPALVQYAYDTANCGLEYDSNYTDEPL